MGHSRYNCALLLMLNFTLNVDDEKIAAVRDYGQGIPLGSVIKAVSILNTSGRSVPNALLLLNFSCGFRAI